MPNAHMILASLIDRLERHQPGETEIIYWACPVPSFGDLSQATVASLGLNPSSREFVDESGSELEGPDRRLHTLTSLGLTSWSDVDARHLSLILDACSSYFQGHPYDAWFKRLDAVVSATRASFYDPSMKACHLDLIPYASTRRWAELTANQRSSLLSTAGDTLAILLRDSSIRTLILNGASVVELFQAMADTRLNKKEMPAWSLPRQSGAVKGIAYWGVIDSLSDVDFDYQVSVLGYNHNLQSSFGVTKEVVAAIAHWVAQASREASP